MPGGFTWISAQRGGWGQGGGGKAKEPISENGGGLQVKLVGWFRVQRGADTLTVPESYPAANS